MARDRRARPRIIIYRADVPGETEAHEARYDSVAEALHFACRDLRSGRRHPLEITEDGAVVYDAATIRSECEREQQELESRLEQGNALRADS